MIFDDAFDMLLGSEGAYSNNPYDRGDETMWGVTRRVALKNGYTGDMHVMPKEFAKGVYFRDYWNAVRANELPNILRYCMFDAAVNSGPARAIIWMQSALRVLPEDGILGPATLKAVWAADPKDVGLEILALRQEFMTNDPTWGQFSRGWARRISKVMRTLKGK